MGKVTDNCVIQELLEQIKIKLAPTNLIEFLTIAR